MPLDPGPGSAYPCCDDRFLDAGPTDPAGFKLIGGCRLSTVVRGGFASLERILFSCGSRERGRLLREMPPFSTLLRGVAADVHQCFLDDFLHLLSDIIS